MSDKAVHVMIAGRVQGVGFRYWLRREAEARSLSGWARNLPDGRVEAAFSGPAPQVDDMLQACWSGPTFAVVRAVEESPSDEAPSGAFEIRR